jgi:hypothetical protein
MRWWLLAMVAMAPCARSSRRRVRGARELAGVTGGVLVFSRYFEKHFGIVQGAQRVLFEIYSGSTNPDKSLHFATIPDTPFLAGHVYSVTWSSSWHP